MRVRGILLLSIVLTAPLAFAADDAVTIGTRHTVTSKILDEERTYWVYLPASYAAGSQGYPVMYLLDGDAHFHSATGVVQFMSTGINGNTQIPEMIVVAIPNTQRTRDLTPTNTKVGFNGDEVEGFAISGGGPKFLQFLRDELFPKIEADYRTEPFRLLVGHSFGGLLAVHALLHEPGMFQAHVAIDPSLWWDGESLVDEAKDRLASASELHRSIYVSLANNPPPGPGEPKKMELAGRRFGMILEASDVPHLRYDLRYFDREDHGSVPLLSLYHGLLFTFDGYKPSFQAFMDDVDAIAPHYEAVSERLGFRLQPPEMVINQMGYTMLYQRSDADSAIRLFELNVANYPESANVYDSLGEAYMSKGEAARAIELYERSLELDPDNTNAVDKLKELRASGD